MKSIIKRLLFVIIIVPLCVLLFIILSPLFAYLYIKDWYSYRRFRKDHSGEIFLVCTTRHSWKDFIQNNLMTTLPNWVVVEWHGRRYRTQNPANISDYVRGIPKPFVAFVNRSGIETISLNSRLCDLKWSAKRSIDVQTQVGDIVAKTIQDLEMCVQSQNN